MSAESAKLDAPMERIAELRDGWRVTVYRLIAWGAIEERIVELHQKKHELATSLLDESHTSALLSPEDLGTCSRRSNADTTATPRAAQWGGLSKAVWTELHALLIRY